MIRTARAATRVILAVALLVAVAPLAPATAAPSVRISAASDQTLEAMLQTRNATTGDGSARADILSAQFLGIPYGANTLIGSATVPEELVVDLQQVDCFTYADYVEALKRSGDREQFLDALADVRYRDGVVDFTHRKHFFTDWAAAAPAVATDVTGTLSDHAVSVTKTLNQRDDGGVYLPGIPTVTRTVSYIPSADVDAGVLGKLHTGDYLGAYATDGGLDVTHVGIVIDAPGGPVFRNASSLRADDKVVDSPLSQYLATVPGIVVLRPVR